MNALNLVAPGRRGLLSRLLGGGVALPVLTTIALGQDSQDDRGKGNGRAGKVRTAGIGKGKGGRGEPANSADAGSLEVEQWKLVDTARALMAEFDADGDNALSLEELTEAMSALHERRNSLFGNTKRIRTQGDAATAKGTGKGQRTGSAGRGTGKGKDGARAASGGGGGDGVMPQATGH